MPDPKAVALNSIGTSGRFGAEQPADFSGISTGGSPVMVKAKVPPKRDSLEGRRECKV